MSDRKPTPRARKPARKTKPAPRQKSPKTEPVAETPPLPPPLKSTNGLAVASLVCAVGGVTLIPVVGGVAAVGLGTAALRRHAREPERYEGKGLAIAGLCIGLVTGVLPVAFLALLTSDDITPIPFVLVALYGGYAVWTALWGTTRRQKALAIGEVSRPASSSPRSRSEWRSCCGWRSRHCSPKR